MLIRAAVFCGHQSVHTVAQSRQETLNSNSIQFWSRDNPVKASDGSDGQVRVVQQTGEGHSRSSPAVGVAEESTVVVHAPRNLAIRSCSKRLSIEGPKDRLNLTLPRFPSCQKVQDGTNSATAMNRKSLSESLGSVFRLRPNPFSQSRRSLLRSRSTPGHS